MEFRILGPLQVLDEGRGLTLGPAKEQTILAVLLLHANEVVSRDRLIDELWGESPPPTAVKAVNVYVSQLRKTLAQTGAEPIATHSSGYAIEVEPDRIDAARFETIVAEARRHAAAGEPEVAVVAFREALSLWRGPALAGLTFESFDRSAVERLDEQRINALLDRIDCELALGAHEQLVGELETVVAQHPLRERTRAQLMLALYRSGRQADALRAYHEARETLVDQLGLEPSPALQRLERGILNHDPALEAPAGISRLHEASPLPAAIDSPPVQVPQTRAAPHRLRRRGGLALTVAVAVAGTIATAVVLATGGSHGLGSLPPNVIGVIDPNSNEITAQVRVPTDPSVITVGEGLVWFTNPDHQTVTELDPRTRTIVRTVGLEFGTANVISADGSGWTVEPQPIGVVDRIAPGAATALSIHIPAPSGLTTATGVRKPRGQGCLERATALTSMGGSIWFICSDGTLGRVNPADNRIKAFLYTAGASPFGIAAAGGRLWIVNSDNTVTDFNPATQTAEQTVTGFSDPSDITAGGNAIWVTNYASAEVTRISVPAPGLSSTTTTIAVGRGPHAIAYGEGSVWVANANDRTISRIDPKTDRVIATIRTGSVPAGIAVGAGRVWVTTQSPPSVST